MPSADLQRRNDLVTANLGLVGYVIREMLGTNQENMLARRVGSHDDLFQHGVLGLINAAEKFQDGFVKNGKVVKFHTYACLAIKRHLQKIISESGVIRVPYCAERSVLFSRHAERARVIALFGALDDGDGQPDSYYGLYAEPTRDALDEAEQIRRMRAAIQRALGELTAHQRQILELRYWRGMTFREIGPRLGFTYQRAQQLHKTALKKLRRLLEGVTWPPTNSEKSSTT